MSVPYYPTISKFKKSKNYYPNMLFEPQDSTRFGQTYKSIEYVSRTYGDPPRSYVFHWWAYGTHKKKKLLPKGQYTLSYILNYYNNQVAVCFDGERLVDKRI